MKKLFIKIIFIWTLICFVDNVYRYIICKDSNEILYHFLISLVMGINVIYWIEEYKDLKT